MNHITIHPRGIVVISKSSEFPSLAELEPFLRWDSRRSDYPDYLAVEKK